jgi:hypothetical protein
MKKKIKISPKKRKNRKRKKRLLDGAKRERKAKIRIKKEKRVKPPTFRTFIVKIQVSIKHKPFLT